MGQIADDMINGMKKYPLRRFEIWIGHHRSTGQGDNPLSRPLKIAEVEAPTFKVACLLHELRCQLRHIEILMNKDKYIDNQSCQCFFNFDQHSNAWLGTYYETEEQAIQSFNKR